MSKLTFAHISDTHILRDYDGTMLEGMAKRETAESLLERAAACIRENYPSLDFAVISGDLVHEGAAEDYAHFKSALERCFGTLPVYLCIGNHDRRSAFREGYLSEPTSNEPYYYSTEIGNSGVRLIVLDSSHDNSGRGMLDSAQLEWLKSELSTAARNGSILVIHHPPYLNADNPMMAAHGLMNATELHAVVDGSDVFAVLSGHTHQVSAAMFGSIPHFTADSTAFGVSVDAQFMSINDRVGFAYCTVEERQIAVSHIPFTHEVNTSARIAISDLLKMMQAHA